MTINTSLPAKSISYGGSRSASSIKYLIYHYTGNSTDTAKANANYFSANGSNTRSAGAHYFVDGTSIYQSISDLKIAYAVGGSKQSTSNGAASMYGTITNTNSIHIEMCSTGGAISSATIENAVWLGKQLMEKYNIDINHVYRHWDCNGKSCPGWSGWTGTNATKWTALKSKLKSATTSTTWSGITTAEVKVHEKNSSSSAVIGTMSKGAKITVVAETDNWVQRKHGGWVAKKYVTTASSSSSTSSSSTTTLWKGVTTQSVKVRKENSSSSEIIGTMREGANISVVAETTNWVQRKHGGWIAKKYVEKV